MQKDAGDSALREYVELDQARIWTATQGHGPPLVLLHGGPGGTDQLQPVADMIGDIVQVHRYEQRACGRSTGDPPFAVERWLDDLEQLRIYWAHEKWIVFGHSFGAELALAYAAAFPSRTRAIIYMSCLPAIFAGGQGEEEFRSNRMARITEGSHSRYAELRGILKGGREPWTPALEAELSRIGLAAEFIDPKLALLQAEAMVNDAPPINREVNVALGADFRQYASSGAFLTGLSGIQCPSLVLHGEHDLRPLWAVEKLVERLPKAELVKLPCGHFPWIEAPVQLSQAIRAFLLGIRS